MFDNQIRQQSLEKDRYLREMAEGQQISAGLVGGQEAERPAQAAMRAAGQAAEEVMKLASDLRQRLGVVLAPEGPQPAGETAQQQRRHYGGSQLVDSYAHLTRISEGTAEILADIRRRLEV